jgi:hypothetical protein
MSSLLAIDSGYPECACAAAFGRRVVWAGALRLDSLGTFYEARTRYDRVIVEIPQADGRSVPVDDLLRVAVAGARLAERFARDGSCVDELRPREWKGSVPKPPHHMRMWSLLDASERELLGGDRTDAAILAACKRGAQGAWKKPGATYYRARELPTVNGTKITHDILDAAALALYALRRLARG